MSGDVRRRKDRKRSDVCPRKDRKRSSAVWQKREEKKVMMSGPGKEKTGRELHAMSGEEKKKDSSEVKDGKII